MKEAGISTREVVTMKVEVKVMQLLEEGAMRNADSLISRAPGKNAVL